MIETILRSTESGIKIFCIECFSSGLSIIWLFIVIWFYWLYKLRLIANQLVKDNTGLFFCNGIYFVGLAFKVSAVPFHMWTPDVYEGAPTSITSYFAVVPKVGTRVAILIKFMLVPFSNILLEWQTIIIFISIARL